MRFGLLAAAALALCAACKDESAGTTATGAREPADKTATRVQVDQKSDNKPAEQRNEQAQHEQALNSPNAPTAGVMPQASANADSRTVTGTVSSASDDVITLSAADNNSLKLKIDPATTISIDGRGGKASQIQPGSDVRASYKGDQSGSDLHALKIDVISTGGAAKDSTLPKDSTSTPKDSTTTPSDQPAK